MHLFSHVVCFLSFLLITALCSHLPVKDVRSMNAQQYQTPRVDLGYEIYDGYYNSSFGTNGYRGIRYAASAAGKNRWQPPRPPQQNRDQVLQASQWPRRCPQGPAAPATPGFDYVGSEDCLFLSVFAPPNATDLPVLVYIHGGGYGSGQGNWDLSRMISENGHEMMGVSIQYRLGAFGFLASDEVYRNGVVNAGLLDQYFALQWVQQYIHLFGGDKTRITIAGESAGGGPVMLQAMAYGGKHGTSLFNNIIASSPYLPMQYNYADWQPSQAYYAFALAAGCFPGRAYGNTSTTIFDCLSMADTNVLQNASYQVGASGTFGTWAFLPVTDGHFLQERPSTQLLSKQINGVRVLSGNNANEGVLFTIQNVTTEQAFEDWTRLHLPLFNDSDISALLETYPSMGADDNPTDPRFATTGTSPPYAVNVSSFGTGQQQRANNLYAETTFVCPSYWLAEAFSGSNHSAYKYQFSVPSAEHTADFYGEGLEPPSPNISPEFMAAFTQIWGNFIIRNDPSISSALANGNSSTAVNPASMWPPFSRGTPNMMNLNETGGVPYSTSVTTNGAPNVTMDKEPGLQNAITLENAFTWEGGRGARCDFWVSYAAKVPE